jgi:hypothetical protein
MMSSKKISKKKFLPEKNLSFVKIRKSELRDLLEELEYWRRKYLKENGN